MESICNNSQIGVWPEGMTATIEGQLAFLDHELHSTYLYVDSRLKAANTANEAAAAIKPYLAKVAEEQ